MAENNQQNRRSRPRPHDLRRKVLLKNFFREQRVVLSPASDTNSDSRYIPDSTSSMDADDNLQEDSNDENNSVLLENESSPPNCPEPKVSNSDESKSASVTKRENDEISFSRISRLSNFMRLRSMSARKRNKMGVQKAKHAFKSFSKSNFERRNVGKIFSRNKKTEKTSASNSLENPPKSLFSLFKSRRGKSNSSNSTKNNALTELSNNNTASCSTSCQSVQTDSTWPEEEIKNYELTNRLLREENKLLSQSLSYFMSNTSENLSLVPENSPQHSSNNDRTTEFLPSYNYEVPTKTTDAPHNHKSKILRSKSVQEQSWKKVTRCHRAKSMNNHSHHPYQSYRTFDSPYSSRNASADIDYRKLRFPRSSVLRTLSANSSGRGIQRRSSMPERTNSENNRSAICRRSGSMHAFDRSRPAIPFQSLPPQAFY